MLGAASGSFSRRNQCRPDGDRKRRKITEMKQARWLAVGAAVLQLTALLGLSIELLAATLALAAALADFDRE